MQRFIFKELPPEFCRKSFLVLTSFHLDLYLITHELKLFFNLQSTNDPVHQNYWISIEWFEDRIEHRQFRFVTIDSRCKLRLILVELKCLTHLNPAG